MKVGRKIRNKMATAQLTTPENLLDNILENPYDEVQVLIGGYLSGETSRTFYHLVILDKLEASVDLSSSNREDYLEAVGHIAFRMKLKGVSEGEYIVVNGRSAIDYKSPIRALDSMVEEDFIGRLDEELIKCWGKC